MKNDKNSDRLIREGRQNCRNLQTGPRPENQGRSYKADGTIFRGGSQTEKDKRKGVLQIRW